MNDLNKRVGFIGAGNMATALISGLINSKYEPLKIIASSPEKATSPKTRKGLWDPSNRKQHRCYKKYRYYYLGR